MSTPTAPRRVKAFLRVGDQEYPSPLLDATLDEAELIFDMSGLRMNEITEAVAAGHPRLYKALVMVVKRRAGENISPEALGELLVADVDFEFRETEAPMSEEELKELEPDPPAEGVAAESLDAEARSPVTTPAGSGSR